MKRMRIVFAIRRSVISEVAIGLGLLLLLTSASTAIPQGAVERIADAKPGQVRVLATAAIRLPLDAGTG